MTKYAIRVEEIIGRTVIVEAESLEKAIEITERAVVNEDILLDGIEDFVDMEVKPSAVFENGIVPEGRDVSFYEHIQRANTESIEEIIFRELNNQTDGFICPNQSAFSEIDTHELFDTIQSLIDRGVLRRRNCDGLAYEYNT